MSQSPAVSHPPVAELERRLQWPLLPAIVFLGLIAGLGIVALVSQVAPPRITTGLPDDPGVRGASFLMHDRTLVAIGDLRLNSALLGDGAVPETFTYLDLLRARRADELAATALARRKWDARVWAARGALALVEGRYPEAERRYRAALARNAHYGEARLGLGVTLARWARFAPASAKPRALELAAIAQFAAVSERDPAYTAALWNRATALERVGRHAEARDLARAYLLRDATSAWAARLPGGPASVALPKR